MTGFAKAAYVAVGLGTIVAGVLPALAETAAKPTAAQVTRGKYLVASIGCNDCHTAGALEGNPDTKRFLGGSDVGFDVPGLGVFVGPNLTPDKDTGLGKWTTAQIVTAFTTGVTPDGRQLAPIMPYMNFANLTKDDATAIALYLQSLPPISNQVPGPFGPTQTPTSLVFTIVPGAEFATLPKPPAGPPPAPAK